MGVRKEKQNNTKIINSITDEGYKKEILNNGYCVGLLVDGVVEERIVIDLHGPRTFNMSFRLNESLILDRHTRKNRLIHPMKVFVYIEIATNKAELITIRAVNKKNKGIPIGISFRSFDVEIAIGDIVWYKADNSDCNDNKWEDEIWFRLDMKNNIGEIYCGIHQNLKSILYLVS